MTAAELAKDCAQLKEIIEGLDHWRSKDVLGFVVDFLMTELLDQGFSEEEIRKAFVETATHRSR